MARIEATVPDHLGDALAALAKELRVSRSYVVDEALGLYLKVVLEAKQGRRFGVIDPASSRVACEIATPTLSAIEWALPPAELRVSPAALVKMNALDLAPPPPNKRLREAVKRRRK